MRPLYDVKHQERPDDYVDGLDGAVAAAIEIDNEFGHSRENLDKFLDALERLKDLSTKELVRICSDQPTRFFSWLGLPNRSILHDIHLMWCRMNGIDPVEIRHTKDRPKLIAVSINFLDEILAELRSDISSAENKIRKLGIVLAISDECSKYRGDIIKRAAND